MTEGLRRHRFLHTASDIFFYCDNPTVLFAIRSQSTSPYTGEALSDRRGSEAEKFVPVGEGLGPPALWVGAAKRH